MTDASYRLKPGAPGATTGAVVGIDLGTTYSAIAQVDSAGHVEVVPNSDGYTTTPSVVFIDGETVLVGREAVKAALLEPEKSADCFKRDMGRPRYSRKVCGQHMRPEVLSAMVLRKLKGDAERKLGPISEAVITVPAYFDDTRRKATQDAGKIAGLNVARIINEPTAAALWHGFSTPDADATEGEIVLIYDLGGGTFDATLMRTTGANKFETIATDGDVMLGGKDWDARLFDYVAGEFMKKIGADPREDDLSYQEFVLRVEEGKRSLSKRSSVTIPVAHGGQRLGVTVTRELFRSLTSDLLARTQTTIELLMGEADLSWDQLSRVMLVGGASRMTMVHEMLASLSGAEPDVSMDADLAVAKGAAVHAATLRGEGVAGTVSKKLQALEHRNVNSHSLGVEAWNDEAQSLENTIIIPKNTQLPCERAGTFATAESIDEGRADVAFRILEGEATDPESCAQIGLCRIEDLPPGLPEGSPVEVTFSYSEEGRIQVSALAKDVNRAATASIFRPEALSSELIEQHSTEVSSMDIV